MNKKKIRNGRIDFLRFFFALIVVLHHSRYLLGDDKCIFLGGSLAVEFFFIVSGYLMISSISRMKPFDETEMSMANETLHFLGKKLKGIFPEFIIAWIIGFAVTIILNGSNAAGAGKLFIESFFELILLKMSGLFVTGVNGVIWYVSAMFLCMVILFPLIRKKPNLMTKLICPLLVIGLYGYLCGAYGHPRNPTKWIGFTYKGNIRAMAGLCLGVWAFEVERWLVSKPWNKISCIFFEILQFVLYVFVVAYMFMYGPSDNDFFFIFLFFVAIILSFSGLGILSGLFNNGVSKALGKFSTALFFSHIFFAKTLGNRLPDSMGRAEKMIIYIACAFICALIVQIISDALRKHGNQIGLFFRKVLWTNTDGLL